MSFVNKKSIYCVTIGFGLILRNKTVTVEFFQLLIYFLGTKIIIMDYLHRIIGAGLGIDDELALNAHQKEKLEQLQLETKLRNEKYILNHPELHCLIMIFLEEVFIKKPENLREFAAEFFTRPDLRKKVQLLLAESYPPEPESEDDVQSETTEEIDLSKTTESYPWDQEGSVDELYPSIQEEKILDEKIN